MPRILTSLLLVLLFVSCDTGLVYSDYKATTRGSWDKDDTKAFNITDPDTINAHQMYILLRNDNTFPYSNIFLIAELEYPNGQTTTDTLEYEMAHADGRWLGKGIGGIVENKLWYKENIVFPSSGVYTVRLSHAMRKNGEVEGIQELRGITDVGLEIEMKE